MSSSDEFEKLRKQADGQSGGLSADCDMNRQKVPKAVEVPKKQYTDMNVDVPAEDATAEYQHTQMVHKTEKSEQVPVS